MKPLSQDLQTPKKSLEEFSSVTKRVLGYLPDIVSERTVTRNYIILSSVVAGTAKFARPINEKLFIFEGDLFDVEYKKFLSVIRKIRGESSVPSEEQHIINSVVYTIQQAIGIGMDFLRLQH